MQAFNQRLLPGILKLFFALLYNQFAWTYDLVAWLVSVGQWKQWVAAVLPFLEDGRILELGHGPGHLQVLVNQQQQDIFGVDLSPQMGKLCWRKLQNHNYPPKIITASGTSLPLADNSFGTVVATFPTEYILLPETISGVFRVLAPGGIFVLVPVAWITGKSPIHRFAASLFRITGQSVEINHPGFEAGRKHLQKVGFRVETRIAELDHSQVLLVFAWKPTHPNQEQD